MNVGALNGEVLTDSFHKVLWLCLNCNQWVAAEDPFMRKTGNHFDKAKFIDAHGYF